MIVIGITGPSGAGKGEASKILHDEYGFSVIDADKVYHSIVSSPSDCVEEIRAFFGDSVVNSNGGLHRESLGKMVLGEANRNSLSVLNKITHKYVVGEIRKKVGANNIAGVGSVIDAPLLIEAGLTDDCDFTIAVIADIDTRAKRISNRDSISMNDALLRIYSQKKDEFYEQHSTYTVFNNGTTDELKASINKILSERSAFD